MTTHRLANARNPFVRVLAGGALLAMCAGQAAAEDTELTQQPFQISLGSVSPMRRKSRSAPTVRTRNGTEIRLGRHDSAMSTARAFRLDGYWRINDRHHVRFMYTENSQQADKDLDRDIIWNGETIPVDASVSIGIRILRL